ncbi:OprD family porin [Pseudomonas silvicola]|nr:OprD family porin [Pseudomonas silvicola]
MPPRLFRRTAGASLCAALAPLAAHADFIQDSKASLELRNFYLNRDFRQPGASQNMADEWAQGFILRMTSGYTEGPVGLGLDALGEVGVKLDSSPDHRGTGLLPYGASNQPANDFSELGVTAKVKVSQTVLKVGTLLPQLPVAAYNDVRLLPSTYSGELLTSQDIAGLTLNAARLTRQNLRDSSGTDDMSYGGVRSAHLDLAGGTYRLTPGLAASYYYARMEDIYRQHFIGLVHDLPLGDTVKLRSDLRYFTTREQGNEDYRGASRVDGGRIDNRFFNGMVTLNRGPHALGIGYQNLSGDGDFAYPGLDPYSINLVTISPFTKAGTDAWQARYDYNFAALGIPGLTFMTRYVDGRHVHTSAVDDGRERERDTDLAYTVQSGPLKNVTVRWRNAAFRSGNGLSTAIDENRVIIGYTVALW